MTVLTTAAVLAMIAAKGCVPPALAPIMVGIAKHESGLDPQAVHRNANGSIDVGLAQVNSSNFAWLGLTAETAFDPCRNLAAGARVLFAKYNGSPPDAVKAAYSADVMRQVDAVGPAVRTTEPAPNPFQRPTRTGRSLMFTTK